MSVCSLGFASLYPLPNLQDLLLASNQIEIDFPMALAGYLDSEAIEFVDCKPNRGRE
jgi:hypothetical protein